MNWRCIVIAIEIIIICLLLVRSNKIEGYNQENIQSDFPNLYYINLKSRKDRKKHIDEQLEKINYPLDKIERINAVKKEDGLLGCIQSHIEALKKGLESKDKFIIIIEDDLTWKFDKEKTNDILNKCLNTDTEWNVILLAVNGNTEYHNEYLNKVINSQTTSGYIIKKEYIPILLNLWETKMEERLIKGKDSSLYEENKDTTVIDQCWKILQNDKWYATNPVLGYQMESYSDIQKGVKNYRV